MLQAETAATSLKLAGEQISDSLLIGMIIKGLPSEEYKPFSTVVTQKDKDLSFGEFKASLRSDTETIHRNRPALCMLLENHQIVQRNKSYVTDARNLDIKYRSVEQRNPGVKFARTKHMTQTNVARRNTRMMQGRQ